MGDKVYSIQLKIRGKNLQEIVYTFDSICAEISRNENVVSYNTGGKVKMALMSRVWDKKKKKMIYDFFIDCDGIVFKRQLDYFALQPQDIEVMYAPGLKDKNNKVLYAGDVIRFPWDGEVCVLEYITEQAGFYLKRKDGAVMFLVPYNKGIEIIGNVFENPDLLKKEVK